MQYRCKTCDGRGGYEVGGTAEKQGNWQECYTCHGTGDLLLGRFDHMIGLLTDISNNLEKLLPDAPAAGECEDAISKINRLAGMPEGSCAPEQAVSDFAWLQEQNHQLDPRPIE